MVWFALAGWFVGFLCLVVGLVCFVFGLALCLLAVFGLLWLVLHIWFALACGDMRLGLIVVLI